MIIFRYLAKEVLQGMLAVSGVLLLIIMSGRFIKYLADAAAGKLAADVLVQIMFFRLPGFLELILPLGLFLGILLAYGRLYLESEMVVLRACGISQRRLVMYTLGPALFAAAIVASMSLWLSPLGATKVESIFSQQHSLTEFDTLAPGRFQALPGGKRVTYTQGLSDDKTQLEQVFISERAENGQLVIVQAERGYRYEDGSGERFLILQNGRRYEGVPGEPEYRESVFGEYGLRLPKPEIKEEVAEIEARPTADLWNTDKADERAQLHWRLSLPVLAIVVTLLAVPLSRTNPRAGRYAKLLPSILIYLVYLAALTTLRKHVAAGQLHPAGLWAVHAGFLMFALSLIFAGRQWGQLMSSLKFWGGRS